MKGEGTPPVCAPNLISGDSLCAACDKKVDLEAECIRRQSCDHSLLNTVQKHSQVTHYINRGSAIHCMEVNTLVVSKPSLVVFNTSVIPYMQNRV